MIQNNPTVVKTLSQGSLLPPFYPILTQRQMRYIVYYGGRGGGKTMNIAEGMVIRMMEESRTGLIYGCYRVVKESVLDSLYAEIVGAIERLDLYDHFYITLRGITRRSTGNRFVFGGFSDQRQVKKIKSMKGLAILWIDEAEGIPEWAWDIIFPSVRGTTDSQLIISFNPESPNDYVYKFFVERKDLRANELVVKINWYDNYYFPSHLNDERLKMKKISKPKYNRIWGGDPAAVEHQMLKPEWWRYYNGVPEVTKLLTGMFITADTACKDNDWNDPSVLQLWGYEGAKRLYLLDQMMGLWQFPELVENTNIFNNRSRTLIAGLVPSRLYIEDKSSGTSLIQTLARSGVRATAWLPAHYKFPKDKVGRVASSSFTIASGCVYLDQTAPYVNGFVEECGAFGELGMNDNKDDQGKKIIHDDQVDAMTTAVSVWLSMGGGGYN